MFENLRRWRDIVGRRVTTAKGEKKASGDYMVRKEKRLKSFIESISAKHKERVEKVAQDKGIKLQKKKAGEEQDKEDAD